MKYDNYLSTYTPLFIICIIIDMIVTFLFIVGHFCSRKRKRVKRYIFVNTTNLQVAPAASLQELLESVSYKRRNVRRSPAAILDGFREALEALINVGKETPDEGMMERRVNVRNPDRYFD